jgi:hypothetical protein
VVGASHLIDFVLIVDQILAGIRRIPGGFYGRHHASHWLQYWQIAVATGKE